jgi:hypothetical protein
MQVKNTGQTVFLISGYFPVTHPNDSPKEFLHGFQLRGGGERNSATAPSWQPMASVDSSGDQRS